MPFPHLFPPKSPKRTAKPFDGRAAPNHGCFGDHVYTIALSKHPTFGYFGLPRLVPLLAPVCRTLLGASFPAFHIDIVSRRERAPDEHLAIRNGNPGM